jgi:alpha-mannosidase
MKAKTRQWFTLGLLAMAPALFGAETQPAEVFRKLPERPADVAHEKNLYVVGYAHLDTQWRWIYPQVIREFLPATLQQNFALFKKYPNYVFNFSGSRRYEMMQEYYPADYAKMKDYIAAGRWFPAGSSVDEGDSVVPSAESLVRHVLYGNHYFRREFGKASDEFMLPDCFGFPYALPTVLAHAGIKGFSTQKLTWGSAVGIPFKVGVWEGPDGRSVVAALDPGAYVGVVKEDLSQSESWLKRINDTGATSGAYVDYHYFGTGDRGGAPAEDSVKWVERSLAGKGPIRVLSGPADRMFNDLSAAQIAKLPRYKGELLLTQHSSGSITSQAYMKRWNRKNELLADAAERASVAALWLGVAPYPTKKLYDAWDLVLGSQMHDMLPGTSHPKAYEFCWNDEILAANQFAAVLEDAAGAVTAGLDTRAQGVPVVVFNPLSIAREDVVEASLTFTGELPARVRVFASDGAETPAQVLDRSEGKLKIAFLADVPSVGFATFDIRPDHRPANEIVEASESPLKVSASAIENSRYRVTIATNGDVASIFDKSAGRALLASAARLSFQYERPELYPAWNMDWADRQKPPRAYVDGPAKVRIVESGPARVALEIERTSEGSRFIQTVRLSAGTGDRVEFATRIDWQTRESSLKASFPLTVANPLATYDLQVGTLARGNNDPKKYEVPQHQWFDLTAPDNSFGVAVLNDSKFGSDKPDDSTMRLTLLYTPGTRDKYQDQGVQDFGRHDILYAVTSHTGDWREAHVPWAAARLNQPLVAFQTQAHPGVLGRTFSLFTLTSGQVAITAVKKAEDSDEMVVRFKELTGQPASGLQLAAAAPIVAAREIDGQERPLGNAMIEQGRLTFEVGGYGLRAFALKLGTAPAKLPAVVSQPLALAFDEDVISSDANRSDGRFDANGRTFPAEQLPAKTVSEGVEFTLGSGVDGQRNALAARGQTVSLPAGDFNRMYFLAAADGDTPARFAIDGHAVDLVVQDWSGYIGQWDNRLWRGDVPETAFNWIYDFVGLAPGYTKRDTVAWFASHRHDPQGNEFYQYCYLFKYVLNLTPGAKALTLPNDPKIRIFAISVAQNPHADVSAAQPLYDELKDHTPDAPAFTPAGGSFNDATVVTIVHPLYWREGALHYTTDGSEPKTSSPIYSAPLSLHRDTVVKAASFDAAGQPGPIASASFAINDTTAPKVKSVTSAGPLPALWVVFSEPMDQATTEAIANYRLEGGASILRVVLSGDGTTALLKLVTPPDETAARLIVRGLRDASPAGNALTEQTIAVQQAKPVFHRANFAPGESTEVRVPNLPVEKGQSWTMNVFVRASQPPENRTPIIGFGRCEDKGANGSGRYFALFANGLHFWSRRREIESIAPWATDRWQMLTASYDGKTVRLYVDGHQIGSLETELAKDEPVIRVAPLDPWDKERRFKGDVCNFAIWDRVLSPEALQLLSAAGPGN